MTRPTLKPSAVVPERREAALITGLESLCRKLSDPSLELTLEEAGRLERAIVKAHVAMSIRVATFSDEALVEPEEVAA